MEIPLQFLSCLCVAYCRASLLQERSCRRAAYSRASRVHLHTAEHTNSTFKKWAACVQHAAVCFKSLKQMTQLVSEVRSFRHILFKIHVTYLQNNILLVLSEFMYTSWYSCTEYRSAYDAPYHSNLHTEGFWYILAGGTWSWSSPGQPGVLPVTFSAPSCLAAAAGCSWTQCGGGAPYYLHHSVVVDSHDTVLGRILIGRMGDTQHKHT